MMKPGKQSNSLNRTPCLFWQMAAIPEPQAGPSAPKRGRLVTLGEGDLGHIEAPVEVPLELLHPTHNVGKRGRRFEPRQRRSLGSQRLPGITERFVPPPEDPNAVEVFGPKKKLTITPRPTDSGTHHVSPQPVEGGGVSAPPWGRWLVGSPPSAPAAAAAAPHGGQPGGDRGQSIAYRRGEVGSFSIF